MFKSNDLDSINYEVEKQISLVKLQLAEIENKRRDHQQRKQSLMEELMATKEALNSPDLATKERAIKDLPALERSYNALHTPTDNAKPLLTQLNYLEQKLHIRKTQSISGFISYITFK